MMGTGGSLLEANEACRSSRVWYSWISCVNSMAPIWMDGTMLSGSVIVWVAGLHLLSGEQYQ